MCRLVLGLGAFVATDVAGGLAPEFDIVLKKNEQTQNLLEQQHRKSSKKSDPGRESNSAVLQHTADQQQKVSNKTKSWWSPGD